MAASTMRSVCVMFMLLVALSDVVSAGSFNITQILEPYPDFRIFNELLSRTKVAPIINSRQTITVLAVDNAAISSITRQPLDNIARILMVNVLLDYFSIPKLGDLTQNTTVTNLFQTTGLAEGHQGFVVVKRSSGGEFLFRAADQKEKSTKLLEEVFKLPYNISVLRVSEVIIPPGMLTRDAPSPAPTAPTPAYAPTPGSHHHAPVPAPAHHAPAPSPGSRHDAPAPAPAPAGHDSSPTPGPDAGDSSSPADDGDDGPDGEVSSGSSVNVGVAVAVAAMSCLVSLMMG